VVSGKIFGGSWERLQRERRFGNESENSPENGVNYGVSEIGISPMKPAEIGAYDRVVEAAIGTIILRFALRLVLHRFCG
jgi:hypothetical protein